MEVNQSGRLRDENPDLIPVVIPIGLRLFEMMEETSSRKVHSKVWLSSAEVWRTNGGRLSAKIPRFFRQSVGSLSPISYQTNDNPADDSENGQR